MSSRMSKRRPSGSFFLLLKAAYDLVEQKQFSEALALLDEILEQSPDDDAALTLRGRIYGRLGEVALAMADLGRSIELNPNNADAHCDYAVAHLRTGNGSEALAALSRVLQLAPDNKRAREWRERLALQLGLDELDQVARVMENFAYSQCGPGREWKVELRELYSFQPNQPPESFNAALLDLCQIPPTFIQVTVTPTKYTLKVNVEQNLPDTPKTGFSVVLSEIIPARHDVLLDVLNSFVDKGILVKVDNQLRYKTGKKIT